MDIYILLGPSAVLLVWMLIDLRKITKHDRVLFRFCRIRRDIISLIDKDHSHMTSEDYRTIRTLLAATNTTIHEFNHFKITFFNLRWFIDWVREYKKTATRIDKLATSHVEINRLKNNYAMAMLCAFLSYTPLLKSQAVIVVSLAIANFLLKMGIKSLPLQSLLNFLSWLKDEMTAHSNHTPQHA